MTERIKKSKILVSSAAAVISIFAQLPVSTTHSKEFNNAQKTANTQQFLPDTKIPDMVPESKIRPWIETEPPKSITIPAINFVSEIQPAEIIKDPNSLGFYTFDTPDSGIATPKIPIKNNVLVFGHSRWQNVPQPFSEIAHLNKGDMVYIKDGYGNGFAFKVSEIKVFDYGDPAFLMNTNTEQSLTLQTTASSNLGWLLDKDEVMAKADVKPQDPIGHLALLVIAKPD